MKEQSIASKKREEKRNSSETLEFRRQINNFLEGKNPEVVYAIKRDLACMTNMPFYKNRPPKIKITFTNKELLAEYMKAFLKHNDKEFIIKLIRWLNKNQAQTIRKIAPKIGRKSEIWEHVIPAKFIVNELVLMINNNDISKLDELIYIYELAGQRGITKDQDLLLYDYRSSMPKDWNWKDKNANPLIRHEIVGIESK